MQCCAFLYQEAPPLYPPGYLFTSYLILLQPNLRHIGLYIRTVRRYVINVTSIYQLSNMQNAQGVARFRRLIQHNKIYRLVYRNTLKFFYKKLPQRPALKVS